MEKLPELKQSVRWIYPDNIRETKYTLLGFNPAFVSKKGNKIPCLVFWGTVWDNPEKTKTFEGEIMLSLWNIHDYKNFKTQWDKNCEHWLEKDFSLKAAEGEKVAVICLSA